MTNSHEIVLEVATLADATLLSNLLELYIHDLSEAFPSIELNPDGRFGYDKLALYWSEPEWRSDRVQASWKCACMARVFFCGRPTSCCSGRGNSVPPTLRTTNAYRRGKK